MSLVRCLCLVVLATSVANGARKVKKKTTENAGNMVDFPDAVAMGVEEMAQKVREDGVVRVDGVVGREAVKSLYDAVVLGLPEQPMEHHNLQLPLLEPVVNVTKDVLRVVGPVFDILFGGDSVLYELCSLVNLNGALRQRTHADFHYPEPHEEAPSEMYSVLLALHDVTRDMGPTEIFPGTHTKESHLEYCEHGCDDEIMEKAQQTAQLATLKAGDLLILDSRIIHRGGPSTHPDPRAYLWLSFLSLPERHPPGSPPTVLSSYVSKFLMSDREEWLRTALLKESEFAGEAEVSGTRYNFRRLAEVNPSLFLNPEL